MINAWIALRGDVYPFIQASLNVGEPISPVKEREYKIFKAMHDRVVVQNMFKIPTIGGNAYYAYSIYFKSNVASVAKTELDYLATEYPSQFFILGAWMKDGRQAGIKKDGAGTPIYPIHANAWRIMPDVIVHDEDGTVVSTTPATSNADLRDINLLAGQEPRNFNV